MNKNSIKNLRPYLLKDWDYEKNCYDPADITIGSDRIIHWKCHKCDHRWKGQAKNRATSGTGCPQCQKRWQTSFNELTLTYYLKHIFNDIKNGHDLSIVGIKEVDIYIPELEAVIEYDSYYYHKDREEVDNLKTKVLTDQKYNVFRLREQDLANIKNAWNFNFNVGKNNYLKTETIHLFIKYMIDKLPIIRSNYNTKQSLNIDVKRDRFNILKQVRPVILNPSLLDDNPEVSSSWDYNKNSPFKPENFAPSSNIIVWWICSENHRHSWEAQINSRNKGHGCPYCSGNSLTKEKSLAYVAPHLAKEWNYSKNKERPGKVFAHSNIPCFWDCPACKSTYDKNPNDRIAGENCPYCAGKRVNETNSLRFSHPSLAKEWHPRKNGVLTPDNVTSGSHELIFWICERDHIYKSAIYGRALDGKGCLTCYKNHNIFERHEVRDNHSSLYHKAPDIAKQWHPLKNKLSSKEVKRYARAEYWWLCSHCKYEWKASPNSRGSSVCTGCKPKK